MNETFQTEPLRYGRLTCAYTETPTISSAINSEPISKFLFFILWLLSRTSVGPGGSEVRGSLSEPWMRQVNCCRRNFEALLRAQFMGKTPGCQMICSQEGKPLR